MPGKAKAKTKTIHGVLLAIFGRGVLIVGGSGSGKSIAAIEMIDRGHRLVADDAVCLEKRDGKLFGSAPDAFRGKIYVPAMGLIDAAVVFGERAYLDETRIELCLELAPRGTLDEAVTARDRKRNFLGVSVPLLLVEAEASRLSPVLVECAVKAAFYGPDGLSSTASASEAGPETFHI